MSKFAVVFTNDNDKYSLMVEADNKNEAIKKAVAFASKITEPIYNNIEAIDILNA